jgi:hypothetical protein
VSVPVLPVVELREAIEAGDWHAASNLIGEHHSELIEALALRDATNDPAASPPAAWVELLLAQRAMLAELRDARDAAARKLAQLGHDRRGARAYLQQEVA